MLDDVRYQVGVALTADEHPWLPTYIHYELQQCTSARAPRIDGIDGLSGRHDHDGKMDMTKVV
jgi:hypothetical protein